ncbi:Regulatory protein, RpfE type [uncultured Candidatus Thioglobus sp.]|nr:Regulatory protein, RpfE type [uncultured Candidatus Thioglobus sp.]
MSKLSLFVPGLFGPNILPPMGQITIPPTLEKYLRFSAHHELLTNSFIRTLWHIFGCSNTQQDCPVAAVTRLVDDDQDVEGVWIRADPVYLRPDPQSITLLDNASFQLLKHEALIFAAEVQDIFTTKNMLLQAPTNNRWYIKLTESPKISTTPIHDVVGCNAGKYLPVGEDKTQWDKLSNEVQTVLHQCPLNKKREECGEFPINGLWMWGGGELPTPPKPVWTHVFSDEVTTRGLSILSGTSYYDLPSGIEDIADQITTDANVLAVLSFGLQHKQYANFEGWQDFIAYLEENWLLGIELLLKKNRVATFELITEKQIFTLTKYSFLQFWKKHKALQSYA